MPYTTVEKSKADASLRVARTLWRISHGIDMNVPVDMEAWERDREEFMRLGRKSVEALIRFGYLDFD